MAKLIKDYKKDIERALKRVSRYNKGLDFQIESLANSLRALALAGEDLDKLESVTLSTVSRYGNETLIPHPVFRIQKDTQELITKQMKALGLTAEDLIGTEEDDPLIDLTKKVRDVSGRKNVVITPEQDPS